MIHYYPTHKGLLLAGLLSLICLSAEADNDAIKATVTQSGASAEPLETAQFSISNGEEYTCSIDANGNLIITSNKTSDTRLAALPMKHGAAMDIAFCTYSSATNKRTVAVTDANYATLYSAFQLQIPSGVTVYAPVYDSGANTLSGENLPEGTIIPIGSGVIIKTTGAGDVAISYAAPTADPATSSSLIGSAINIPTAEVTPSGQTLYTFAKEGDNVGFYQFSGTNVGWGKAFLLLPTSNGAKATTLELDGEPTGIDAIMGEETKSETADCWNFAGQRVSASTRGIVVRNGKKIINK